MIYTENFFVKFDDDATPAACRKLLQAHKLEIKRPLEYARNAFFAAAAWTRTPTYDTANPPTLAALHGKSPQGTWTLVVQDKERADTGKIRGFTLEMTLEPRPSRQSEGSAHWRLERKQNPNHPSPACLSSFRRIRTTPWTC